MKKIHTHSKSQTSFLINSLPQFAAATPKEYLDLRCEYDVPRFFDLTQEIGSECEYENIDERVDEEYFKWFQIAHDFKVNKKQIHMPKEMSQNLPPRYEHQKTGSTINSKIQKQASLVQSTIETKNQQAKSIKQQLQEKLNGSQTERNIKGQKPRPSRNILSKNSSSTILNTIHRMKGSQKSFDATNCNLFQKLTALNQQSQLAQIATNKQDKTEKIKIDLTPISNHQQIKFTSNSEKMGKLPGNKTQREMKANNQHQRVDSSQSRKDFISRNKDIVKLLSARSKERKVPNSGNGGLIEELVETPLCCEIVLQPKLKESQQSVTNQVYNQPQKNHHIPPTHSKQHSQKALLQKDDINKVYNFQSFLGGSTGGSGSVQQSHKKKNGRVNSQLQIKPVLSNNNLLKQSMVETYKAVGDEDMLSTGNTTKKHKQMQDQENSIAQQNTYIKQIIMMQEKYQLQRTRQRNQGIGSSFGGGGTSKNNMLNSQLSEKFGLGMVGGGTLQNFKDFHNQKQLPTKKNSAKIQFVQNTTRDKRKREPLVSHITLENL